MTGHAAARRYAVITFLTWLPVGLYLPAAVLLLLDRGVSVGSIAAIGVAYSVTVTVLELPTGGLADVLGRRVVLAAAAVANLAGVLLLGLAHTVALFAVSAALRGIGRALGSGPAEAWFVDAVHATDGPDADLGPGLSRGGAAGSIALAAGTLAGGAIPLLLADRVTEALAVPMLAAAGIEAVRLVVTLTGMPERRPPRQGFAEVVRGIAPTIRAGLRLSLGDQVIGRLLVVVGMTGVVLSTIELLTPVWLATLTGSTETAGVAYAIVAAVGFAADGLGSALSTKVTRRIGSPARAGAAGLVLCVVALAGLAGSTELTGYAGVAAAGAAYSLIFVGLGIASPAQAQLTHARVAAGERATVISVQSVALQLSGTAGAVLLGNLAGRAGPVAAFAVAAACLAASLPLLTGRGLAGALARPRPVPASETGTP